MQDAEKIVVAKPVASRPYSSLRSFSELLADAMIASPSISFAEATVTIKPKAVRFEPSPIATPAEVSSLDGMDESDAFNLSDKASTTISKAEYNTSVLYKPAARVVSRTTASLLANPGNFDARHQKPATDAQAPAHVQEQEKHQFQYQPTLGYQQNSPSQIDMNHIYEPSEQNTRTQQPATGGDRPSYDGYNWRKYGQKIVKGSECPRSYYKCTHPTCPVKKKVERLFDGQIAEIVYKGEHDHPKPQSAKRLSSGSQWQNVVSEGHGRESGGPLQNCRLVGGNVSDGQVEHGNEISLPDTTSFLGQAHFSHDPPFATSYNNIAKNPDTTGGLSGASEVGNATASLDNDKPNYKRRYGASEVGKTTASLVNDKPNCNRSSGGTAPSDEESRCNFHVYGNYPMPNKLSHHRKNEDRVSGAGAVREGVAEPHSATQTSIESDVSGDGYHWRKYGQKVVKGNLYPRSYYRCTTPNCNVRKYVEKASDDSGSFVTTYEGKHNHEMQAKKTN